MSMKAVVIYEAGGPEVLKVETRKIPVPQLGQVLIRVKAFGLNRSELFTRQGHSPSVKFPRILGIEAVGLVEEAPGNEFKKGDVVATVMGGLGRDFDGGYAEYTCVPVKQVQTVKTQLDWGLFAAIPEMLQTAYGSLFTSLALKKGETLLIRGGTTTIGLAASAIAKNHGVTVLSTSRRADREPLLRQNGVDKVIIDNGSIAEQVRKLHPQGIDKALELIGVTTLEDTMACVRRGGLACMTGIVGNKWSFENFNPMERIPKAVGLTSYSGSELDFMATPLEELIQQIKEGALHINIGKTYKLDDIVEAHRVMESNTAGGKIVVLT